MPAPRGDRGAKKEAKRVWKKREGETKGANASEEEGERENDSSSIYISSHSRLPETGAFPSKPGIGTKQMSFGKRMKTSLFLAASGLAHYGGRIVDRDLFSLRPDAKPASTCPSDKFPESWSLLGCSRRHRTPVDAVRLTENGGEVDR